MMQRKLFQNVNFAYQLDICKENSMKTIWKTKFPRENWWIYRKKKNCFCKDPTIKKAIKEFQFFTELIFDAKSVCVCAFFLYFFCVLLSRVETRGQDVIAMVRFFSLHRQWNGFGGIFRSECVILCTFFLLIVGIIIIIVAIAIINVAGSVANVTCIMLRVHSSPIISYESRTDICWMDEKFSKRRALNMVLIELFCLRMKTFTSCHAMHETMPGIPISFVKLENAANKRKFSIAFMLFFFSLLYVYMCVCFFSVVSSARKCMSHIAWKWMNSSIYTKARPDGKIELLCFFFFISAKIECLSAYMLVHC